MCVIILLAAVEVRWVVARRGDFESTDLVRFAAWLAALTVHILEQIRLVGTPIRLRTAPRGR